MFVGSLMKRILKRKYGKKRDWREPYRKSRRFDRSCRCHGGCPWCLNNKLHKLIADIFYAEKEILSFKKGLNDEYN